MTARELYTKGARIWLPHPELVWESATVTQDFRSGVLICRKDQSGEIHQIKIPNDTALPPLRNPSILVGQNDLTSLSYLHEPAVLHNLKVRFCDRNAIYTYCGIVLVAINPYNELPIYGDETIMAYRGQAMGDLDPHIFAVSEEAYTKLEREKRDQSIIVSGESGAGKTVSAKYAMRYFAAVGGNSSETHVERKVLASSPIMEAIGNAKTTRNDNSSRFGKFIQIHFDRQYRIRGASMRTYLLEKSRVVYQAVGERNYHIFYQLCAARGTLPHLGLDHQDTFHYLNQGGNPYIDGLDDAKTFQETKQALTTLGFTEHEETEMFTILAAILHLGNVTLHDGDPDADPDDPGEDGAYIQESDKHFDAFCALLGAPRAETRRWLTHRRLASAHEVIVARMDAPRAAAARDALAKRLYADLFSWCVRGVNRALEKTGVTHHFIGVLDIYGFETFEINSFEQFCINYANEKLQQQFNSHVFKLEQDEYIKEQITWKMISFSDNQPCIELIESRLGVLDLLDEECRVPQGSDRALAGKLYEKCSHYPHFVRPRFGDTTFIIKHFADDVEYQTGGFLEKNRDTVWDEQLECVRAGRLALLAAFRDGVMGDGSEGGGVKTMPPPQKRKALPNVSVQSLTQPARRNAAQKQTVGAQFRASLAALTTTLSATTPHYVRCIKPNDVKKAFNYDSARAVQQLRACGVLETIRISAAGFPSRWLYQDFFQRYRLLCRSSDIDRNDIKETCKRILMSNIKDPEKYQFGMTKIFFRAGQVAYLEKVRADLQRLYCVRVQSQVRGFLQRRKFKKIMRAVRGLQVHGRGYLARRRAQDIRRQRAAVVLQAHVRGWLARLRYQRLRRLAIGLQARTRGLLARRRYKNAKREKAAIIIQRNVRGWLSRKRVERIKRQIIICQAAVRRFLARRQYKKLRKEARSLEHIKNLNRGLENKIISLQQKLGEVTNEVKALKPFQLQVVELKSKMEMFKAMETELKTLRVAVVDKDSLLDRLQQDLMTEQDNIMQLLEEKDALIVQHSDERKKWDGQKEDLESHMRAVREEYEQKIKELAKEHEAEKKHWAAELESERSSRQKLLSNQYDLQEKLDSMDRKQTTGKEHRRSLSDVSMNSQQEPTVEDDYGYGSVRSTDTARPALETVNWSAASSQAPSQNGPTPMADAGLVLRLQHRIASLQSELSRTASRAIDLEDRLAARIHQMPPAGATEEAFKVQELEIENMKLLEALQRLRSAAASGDKNAVSREVNDQMTAMAEELSRRRDECIQLRSVLANQTVNLKSLASSSYGSDVTIINEDGELAQAFEAQKKITRQLEDELTAEKRFYKESILEYKSEIERLRDDNERQQKLLSVNLSEEPRNQSDQYTQNEIIRLVADNLALQERIDTLSESCRRYKNQIRLLAEKLREAGVEDVQDILDNTGTEPSSLIPVVAGQTRLPAIIKSGPVSGVEILPTVRKKEREYLGMFDYNVKDEAEIVHKLITDLKPPTARAMLPGLPAYILFMMLRHMDHVDDEPKMHQLMKSVRIAIKKTVKRHLTSIDYISLWLANMLRLLNNLRQYSGDEVFAVHNTSRQNQQCLRVFDLSEYRQVLSDTAIWIYQGLISLLESQLERLIVPGILEYEEISGVGTTSSSSHAKKKSPSGGGPQKLTAELNEMHKILKMYGVDDHLILNICKQLLYFVCAYSLNQLLLRKDLCCWAKGLQIRYNISHLEVWIKENLNVYGQASVEDVLKVLRPITQAVQLLQARKSMDDVDSTIEMCADLSAAQICKILNMYTLGEDYELKISRDFIKEIQKRMQERDSHNKQQPILLMDSKHIFAIQFPFNPTKIRLEDIELPEVLGISHLLTKI